MAATKTKNAKKSAKSAANGKPVAESSDVLTLAEAAAYLRVSEDDIIRMAREQSLPGRFLGNEWRFLKSALQTWLSTPIPHGSKEAIQSLIGSWKDDPYVEQELKEIYARRGRPMTENDE